VIFEYFNQIFLEYGNNVQKYNNYVNKSTNV